MATLTTACITEPDLGKAGAELIANARTLIAAGRFADARAILSHLLAPGPWRLPKHGRAVQELEQLLPMACFLCGLPCPPVGALAAQSKEEIALWGAECGRRLLDELKTAARHQLAPAGARWSTTFLDKLAAESDQDTRDKFQQFCVDAEFFLKDRLLKQFANASAPSLAALEAAAEGRGELDFDGYGMADVMNLMAPIKVAKAAQGIPSSAVSRATAMYLLNTGMQANYLTDFTFQAAMLLDQAQGKVDDAVGALTWLADSEMGMLQLVKSASLDIVQALLVSRTASLLAITDEQVAGYLQALAARVTPAHKARAKPACFTGDSLASFKKLLAGTPLAKMEIVELPVCDTPEKVYAIQTTAAEMEALWRLARSLVPQTGRWPVITTSWGEPGTSLKETVENAELFSRFYFEESPGADDVSPRGLLATVENVDVSTFIQKKEALSEAAQGEYSDFNQHIKFELDDTRKRCGAAPTRKDIARAGKEGHRTDTFFGLDRWLMAWEEQHGGCGKPEDALQDWFEQEPMLMIFLPTPHSWDALAYMNWYGSAYYGVENYIALGRQWQRDYGAELFAHFGTMLECFADRPPASSEEAWQLAKQHDLVASSTLGSPGITLRHYASALRHTDRWFLHNRP